LNPVLGRTRKYVPLRTRSPRHRRLARHRTHLRPAPRQRRRCGGRRRPQSEKLNELVTEITAAGGKASAFALDVADEDQVKAAAKAAIAQFGKIDILVNNAGITRDQLVMRMKRADWDAVLQTNLTSAYLCIQSVIPSMLKQRWGRIINITSVFGQMGQAGQANYPPLRPDSSA
jgi:NAD(P)-dependent dehydrogenase (short-subunit alcohol dehydrogenase family)